MELIRRRDFHKTRACDEPFFFIRGVYLVKREPAVIEHPFHRNVFNHFARRKEVYPPLTHMYGAMKRGVAHRAVNRRIAPDDGLKPRLIGDPASKQLCEVDISLDDSMDGRSGVEGEEGPLVVSGDRSGHLYEKRLMDPFPGNTHLGRTHSIFDGKRAP